MTVINGAKTIDERTTKGGRHPTVLPQPHHERRRRGDASNVDKVAVRIHAYLGMLRTIDFHRSGTRPAPRKISPCSRKPALTNSSVSVLLLQKVTWPPSQFGLKWRSHRPAAPIARFFRYPWYGVEQMSRPPGLRAE